MHSLCSLQPIAYTKSTNLSLIPKGVHPALVVTSQMQEAHKSHGSDHNGKHSPQPSQERLHNHGLALKGLSQQSRFSSGGQQKVMDHQGRVTIVST